MVDTNGPRDWILCDKAFSLHEYAPFSFEVDKLARVRRGDVVLLRSPSNPNAQAVKRVVALPGDRVRTPRAKTASCRLPTGRVWVESDNAGVGRDSNAYGAVPLGLVQGKVVCVVWPPSRWGAVPSQHDDSRITRYSRTR